MATLQEKRISGFVEPVLTSMGFDLVALRIIGSKKLQTLQIMAENAQTGTIDLESCSKVSRAISAVLDVEDPISGAYQLEVSSPGIDRPLTRVKDFEKHIGYEITLETETPSDAGQKNYRGKITAFDGQTITLAADQAEVAIDFTNVARAKLVLTDELIKAALKKRSEEKNESC
ncbi:MAG: ribosome maturation factor RimP [Pseudobdellovibrionaceae bacterium]